MCAWRYGINPRDQVSPSCLAPSVSSSFSHVHDRWVGESHCSSSIRWRTLEPLSILMAAHSSGDSNPRLATVEELVPIVRLSAIFTPSCDQDSRSRVESRVQYARNIRMARTRPTGVLLSSYTYPLSKPGKRRTQGTLIERQLAHPI